MPLLGPSFKLLPTLEGRMQVKVAANRNLKGLWCVWWSGASFRGWFSPPTMCPGVQTQVLRKALLPTEPCHLAMKEILTNSRRKVNLWSREVKALLQRSMQNGGAIQANQSKSYPDEGRDREVDSTLEEGKDSLEWFLPGQCFLGHLDPTTSIIHSKSVSPSPVPRLTAPPMLSFHSVFN